jgi:hypothetical protein
MPAPEKIFRPILQRFQTVSQNGQCASKNFRQGFVTHGFRRVVTQGMEVRSSRVCERFLVEIQYFNGVDVLCVFYAFLDWF